VSGLGAKGMVDVLAGCSRRPRGELGGRLQTRTHDDGPARDLISRGTGATAAVVQGSGSIRRLHLRCIR